MYPRIFLALAITLLVTPGAEARSSVNKSVNVAAGETLNEGVSTVNGSITIGADAELAGEAETVNGTLSIEEGARTRDLSSVNGMVRIADRVTVDGDVSTVNGTLRIGGQATISGNVETVNGTMDLRGAVVERDIETVNGHVVLSEGTRVQGNLLISGKNKKSKWSKTLDIELRDGSTVEGDVRVEDEHRKVRIILSGGSAVSGRIEGAEVVRE